MYHKTKGEKITIESLEMWLPPVPQKHLIEGYQLKKEDQYWRRTTFPVWWKEERQKERKEQDAAEKLGVTFLNPKYPISRKCESFRVQEWDRRLYGFWFFNNGKPTYITGSNYYYLNWCKLDVGYPEYYEYTKENFYFREYCEEDPACLGYAMMGKRGYGKTAEEHCAQLENITRSPTNRNGVIQSKSYADAKKNFKAVTVQVWKNLPDFFSPVSSSSSDPSESLEFFKLSVKGKSAKDVIHEDGDELANQIYCVAAKDEANDGQNIHDLIVDEWGKVSPEEKVDLEERHRVNKHTVYRNDKKIGIMRCMSTVEELTQGAGNEGAKRFWQSSNQNDRNALGLTESRLYRRFLPVFATTKQSEDGKTVFLNKYGQIDQSAAKEYELKIRKSLENNPRALASHARKNPLNEEEPFGSDNEKCEYNIGILNSAKNKYNDTLGKRLLYGKFIQDKKTLEVSFQEATTQAEKEKAKWHISYVPTNVGKTQGFKRVGFNKKGIQILEPVFRHKFILATDCINRNRDPDRVQSKASASVFYKLDQNVDNANDFYAYCNLPLTERELFRNHEKYQFKSHNYISDYLDRPDDEKEYYEDMRLACLFFGCKMLPERNTWGIVPYFIDQGCEKFVMKRPKSSWTKTLDKDEDYGIPSNEKTIGIYVSKTKTWVERHGHRLNLPRIINDWVKFDSTKTTKFDTAVGASFCQFDVEEPNTTNIEEKDEEPKAKKSIIKSWNRGRVSR